jgi:hypothetical protein
MGDMMALSARARLWALAEVSIEGEMSRSETRRNGNRKGKNPTASSL